MARSAEQRAFEWSSRLLGRLSPEQYRRLSEHMLDAIDKVSRDRWEAAQARAARSDGQLRPERVKELTASFARELGAAGAAAGAVAAAPAVGTVGTIASSLAELGWFTSRAGDLILTMAAIHGRPAPTVDERRAWVLAVLIYGSSARNEFSNAIHEASSGLSPSSVRGLPLATLQTANQIMAKSLLHYGTRRGAVTLARLLPLGVGAVLGGGANYVAIRRLSRDADQFFSKLPYSSIEVDATDITGREL